MGGSGSGRLANTLAPILAVSEKKRVPKPHGRHAAWELILLIFYVVPENQFSR
jgi:hypothetical protein